MRKDGGVPSWTDVRSAPEPSMLSGLGGFGRMEEEWGPERVKVQAGAKTGSRPIDFDFLIGAPGGPQL